MKLIKKKDASKVIGSNCGLHECIGRDKWITHNENGKARFELQSDRNRYLQAALTYPELTRKMYNQNYGYSRNQHRPPPNWRYTFFGVEILGDAQCEQFKVRNQKNTRYIGLLYLWYKETFYRYSRKD